MNNILSEFVLKSLKIRYIFEVHVYVFTFIADSKWYTVDTQLEDLDFADDIALLSNARLVQHNYRSIITNRSESKQEQNQGFT